MPETTIDWDVAVVGAGPAGLAAARAAASAGARTVVLERAAHPRYKTCGGRLTGASQAAYGDDEVPARTNIHTATFTLRGRRPFTRRARGAPLLAMVRREEFDSALRDAAVRAGAVVRERVTARGITEHADHVGVRLQDGTTVTAR